MNSGSSPTTFSEPVVLTTCEVFALPVYVHDEQGRIIDVNQPGCEQLGYTREECLALQIWDIEWNLSRADLQDIWQRLQKAGSMKVRGQHRRKDGSTLPVEVRIHRCNLQDEVRYVLLVQDITPQVNLETRLNILDQILREVFDHAPVSLAILDAKGRFVRCNRVFCRLLGYQEAELLEKAHDAYLHPDDIATALRLTEALGKPYSSEYLVTQRYIHRGGQALQVQELVLIWHTPDVSFKALLMAWPPETRVQPFHADAWTSDHLRPWVLARRITEEFVHGLSQPLNSLAMFATAGQMLLKRDEVPMDKVSRSLDGLVEQVARAQKMTSQFLAFLPAEDDDCHSFSVNEVVHLLERQKPDHEVLKRFPVHWNPEPGDLRLAGSAKTFRAVVTSLLQELALSSSSSGNGPSLQVTIEMAQDPGQALFKIELFATEDRKNHRHLDETVTWAICRDAVEAHHGRLALGPGYGTADGHSACFTWPKSAP